MPKLVGLIKIVKPFIQSDQVPDLFNRACRGVNGVLPKEGSDSVSVMLGTFFIYTEITAAPIGAAAVVLF